MSPLKCPQDFQKASRRKFISSQRGPGASPKRPRYSYPKAQLEFVSIFKIVTIPILLQNTLQVPARGKWGKKEGERYSDCLL